MGVNGLSLCEVCGQTLPPGWDHKCSGKVDFRKVMADAERERELIPVAHAVRMALVDVAEGRSAEATVTGTIRGRRVQVIVHEAPPGEAA